MHFRQSPFCRPRRVHSIRFDPLWICCRELHTDSQ